jgi:hypothetical protein
MADAWGSARTIMLTVVATAVFIGPFWSRR